MRVRDQLVVAVLLAVATWFGFHRIAEAKNEAAVGGAVFPLDDHRRAEVEAFEAARVEVARRGDPALADRLARLRADGEIWIAPRLGPDRWAVYVESLSLVRRIYIRQEALLDPVAHLYREPRPEVPPAYQQAHAWLSLAGALRHEIAHRDGLAEELAAYGAELAWYEERRRAPSFRTLPPEERRAWEWGLESAVLSARKAQERALQSP